MENRFTRTESLIGKDAVERLAGCRVAVFGVGGVGSYVVEALARSGVGALDLIDKDVVDVTNINRQLIALTSTVGRPKVDVARDRVLDINPDCRVTTYQIFYLPETAGQFDFSQYDYIVDAIDTVAGKLALVERARDAGVPIICSMGAGNKLDPAAFRVADIYETSVCPLAKVMRRECRKRGIESLKVVYSREEPVLPQHAAASPDPAAPNQNGAAPGNPKAAPGSIAFVPSVAGLILAGEVVKDLSGIR